MFLIAVISFVKQLNKTLKITALQKETKLKDKSKNVITGSIEDPNGDALEINDISPGDADTAYKAKTIKGVDQQVSPEEVEEILQRLLDADWDEESVQEVCKPSYMLSLEKDVEYLYSLSRRTFVPVKNNLEVIPINNLEEPFPGADLLKNYYAINNEIFDIAPDKVICIGWNQ